MKSLCPLIALAIAFSASPAVSEPVKKHPANLLAKEKSPYLLQHAHNPVQWHPWGDAAFEKAKKENKPILLSIGYSTCHWCHVMERESFENEDVAKILNEHFISIKLDREERPDVDNIYMTAMQALELGGGWPLNVFLTPEKKPFYGGTYFKTPVFKKLLEQIAEKWKSSPDALHKDANNIAKGLAEVMEKAAPEATGPLKAEWVAKAAAAFTATYDANHAGFGKAPKFPQPQVPELILMNAFRTANKAETDKVLHTCRRMAAGGMYDSLGGGFARYSVDEEWLVPHFEKMLYDNAQLVQLYLNAHLISGEATYAEVVHNVLTYILRDMTSPEGGFYSAEDADSEGHEGKFYTWTKAELQKLLTPEEFAFAEGYFTITDKGNFEDHSHPAPLKGQNILARKAPETQGLPLTDSKLASIRKKLFNVREKRIHPHLDDKILSSWNGLMLGAMARAGVVLQEPRYIAAAQKNLILVQTKLWDAKTKTLYHRYRDGERDSTQLLGSYASYLQGTLHLYEATLDAATLTFAIELAESMIQRFYDPKLGGFYTSGSHDDLLFKVKDDYDSAEPSGNSQAIYALLKLAHMTDRKDFREKADKSLAFFSQRLAEVGEAVPLMLQALDYALHEPYRIVISGDPTSPDTIKLLQTAHSVYQPWKVVLNNNGPVEEFAKKQLPVDGKPTAYVCTGTSCRQPTNDPSKIKEYLKTPAK